MHNLCNILACACKETVGKCRESSRGSGSPSKRPLLGGECPSNYIRKTDGDFDRQLGTIPVYFLTKLYVSNLIKVCR